MKMLYYYWMRKVIFREIDYQSMIKLVVGVFIGSFENMQVIAVREDNRIGNSKRKRQGLDERQVRTDNAGAQVVPKCIERNCRK